MTAAPDRLGAFGKLCSPRLVDIASRLLNCEGVEFDTRSGCIQGQLHILSCGLPSSFHLFQNACANRAFHSFGLVNISIHHRPSIAKRKFLKVWSRAYYLHNLSMLLPYNSARGSLVSTSSSTGSCLGPSSIVCSSLRLLVVDSATGRITPPSLSESGRGSR